MAKINRKLAESINRTMVDFLLENYERYYLFTYSIVRNADQTKRILEKTIYFSLYNSRKLKTLPPMKVWFYQLIIKDGMRKMHELDKYKRDFTYNSQLYAYMETLEPSSVNAFKLYYFEKLSLANVAEIMRMKPQEVESKISYVRHNLKIDKYLEDESADKMNELIEIYESAEIPDDIEDIINTAVKRERENFERYMDKQHRMRFIKPAILIICIAIWFIATIVLAKENESFGRIIINVPIVKYLFIPFIG